MSGTIGVSPNMNSGVVGGYPTDSILQMFNIQSQTQTSVAAGADFIIVTKTFNRKEGNSHFICQSDVKLASLTNISDLDPIDPILSFVVNGTLVDSNTLIMTSWDDGYWKTSVPDWRAHGVTYPMYDVYGHYVSEDMTHISSGRDNDSVTIAVRIKANNSAGILVNRAMQTDGSGGLSSLTIYEIAS
jgi:hypothetical protein